MFVSLLAALLQAAPAAQSPAPSPATHVVARADTTGPERDSTERRHRTKKPAKRVAVTAQHLATAFKDPAARDLLLLARASRTRQDSALQGYDATTYQRISAGLALTSFGRDRLAFRSEQSTRVRWRRGVGAYVEVTGSRAVAPIAGKSANVQTHSDISPIPYYPGSETLWIGASAAQGQVDENEGIVHPLAEGSEAYYTYASGDSATFRLPDGHAIRLRELQVRPRVPQWNLAVGSLWFDLSSGQLVRAAYRMSVPMDIKAVAEADDSTSFEDVPRLVRPMLFPMTAQVSAIGVEYGLYQGRFWLPRLQVLEGGARVGVMRVPFKLEQRYLFDAVNAVDPLPPIVLDSASRRQSAGVDVSIGQSKATSDSVRRARREARNNHPCDSAGNRHYTRSRENGPPIAITMSCDTLKLASSKDLPPSIYAEGEETVSSGEMDALVQQALSMGAQAGFAPAAPEAMLDNFRYNRVEGLSLGGHVEQQLGAGYSARASARIGTADREPNVELSGARSDLRRTISLTAYNHLVSAGDWGHPLSLGSSISAFLFGRDEGFYYRSSGLELASAPDAAGGGFTWSLFAEQERTAAQRTTFSVARAVHGSQFEPNLVAQRGIFAGARTRFVNTLGLDPQGFRLLSDIRLEAAHGDSGGFGRAAADFTASHGLGSGGVALTVAGGSSLGVLPAQRFWYLGGTQTVRGQRPGRESGDAFWLARGEYGFGASVVRPVLFGDLGWAGKRSDFTKVGVPMSGVGAGFSILDGLVRFDVARGINPDRQWRVDTYIEGRF